MKLKDIQFCGLARQKRWQDWLGQIDQASLGTLKTQIMSSSCGDVRNVMLAIKKKLYDGGHGPKFEEFIKQNYPFLIIKEQKEIKQAKPEDRVFKKYVPGLLTFPRKHVISGDERALSFKVRKFIQDKISVDYVIVGNKAYIEYFNGGEEDLASSFPKEKREIQKYRNAKNLDSEA